MRVVNLTGANIGPLCDDKVLAGAIVLDGLTYGDLGLLT